MKSLVAAFQFLSICPLVCRIPCNERQIGRSVVWFPLLGLLAGGVAAGVGWAAAHWFTPLVASVMSVLVLMAVSGGLHADGLADTADGFLSSRPRERVLEIMRDSRIGAMGVLALLGVFSLKCAALVSVPTAYHWEILLLMGLAGRCSMVLQLSWLPYARKDGGLCSVFVRYRSLLDPWLAVLVLGLGGWGIAGKEGLFMMAGSVVAILIFSAWCRRKIGGFTGDTLGAGCEIVELIPALMGVTYWSVR